MEFKRLDDRLIGMLEGIVGSSRIIWGDSDALTPYGRDESGIPYAYLPEAVVKPESKDQVSEILNLASEERIPVTPRGAGSGLSGGSVPLFGGIVISCERMGRILDIDTKNLVAVVEPGVVTNDLCKEVASFDLYYAGYPMSVETSFIGGNVATNAGGSKVMRYGGTVHHVLGLEVVVPSGSILEFGGKRRKDSSGYAMHRLFVGSEGTLGFFAKVYLNLIPAPGASIDLLIPFSSLEDAAFSVSKIVVGSKELPSALELMDGPSFRISSGFCEVSLPYADKAEAYLLVQFEGRDRDYLDGVLSGVADLLTSLGALDALVADTPRMRDDIWKVRRMWLEALKAVDRDVVVGDVVVSTSKIPDIIRAVSSLGEELGVVIPMVAHAGDGNVHPAPLRPQGMGREEWFDLRDGILDRISHISHSLGGAVSGEHGIGFLKSKTLYTLKKNEVEFMFGLKRAVDPHGIMNPGKIFSRNLSIPHKLK